MKKHSSFFRDEEIDQALKQLVEPPAGLEERIIAACHAASWAPLDEEEFLMAPATGHHAAAAAPSASRWRPQLFNLAAAAAVAILCAGATVLTLGRKQTARSASDGLSARASDNAIVCDSASMMACEAPASMETVEYRTPRLATAVDAVAGIAPGIESRAAYAPDAPQAFSLRDSQRLHAAFAGNAAERATAASTYGAARRRISAYGVKHQELPDAVTQVWLTRGKIPTQAQLDQLPQKVPGGSFTLVGTDSDGCTTIRIAATDTQLQAIVDALHEQSGLTLLSPSLPQPGEADAVSFKGKEVVYTMKLLKE